MHISKLLLKFVLILYRNSKATGYLLNINHYEVNGNDAKILVGSLNINIEGGIYLKKPIIVDEFRRVLVDMLQCTLRCNIRLNIDSSEGQIIFFNNLKYEDVLESNRPANSPPLGEWQLPLIKVLVSPINVLLVVLAFLISLKLNYVNNKLRVKRP